MTCIMQEVKQSPFPLQEWKTMFPDFTTLTGSVQFIKKLMAVSISGVTYMRGIFPEKAYGERQFCGIKLKLLTEDSGIESVNKFINLIRSCYDAVEKKYLQELNIGISTDPENRDEVVESYNMRFRYKDDEYSISNTTGSMQLKENDPTVEATFWLLKSIVSVSDILGPLPNNAFLTMKLLYNDDITPPDYEPPGFESCDVEKFTYAPNSVKLELGKVATDIHCYTMYLKTALTKHPLSQIIEEQAVLAESQRSRENIETEEQDNFILQTQEGSKSNTIKKSQTEKHTSKKVECICDCKQDSDTDIIQCSSCRRMQHSVCYGILNAEDMESEFYCVQCINEVPFRSSQEDLIYTYDGNEQMELCALRRALVFCSSLKQVTAYQLEKGLKCNKQLSKELIERLEFEGFIRKSGQKYIVNDNKIRNSGFREYFPRKNKENVENMQQTTLSKKKLQAVELENRSKSRLQRKPRTNEELLPEDQIMDYAIDEEVERLNLKGSSGKQANKTSRRRSLKVMNENDDSNDETEDILQRQPAKRRCKSTKEAIAVRG